jgi:hypothetical protein
MTCVQWRLRWVLQRHHEPPILPHPSVIRKALFLPTAVHLHVPDPAREDTAHIRTGNSSPRGLCVRRLTHGESAASKLKNWTQLLSDSFKLGPSIVVIARMNLEQQFWMGDTNYRLSTTDSHWSPGYIPTLHHDGDCPQSSNAWNNTKLGFFLNRFKLNTAKTFCSRQATKISETTLLVANFFRPRPFFLVRATREMNVTDRTAQ